MSTNVLKNRRVLFVTNRRHRVDEAYQCFAGFGDTRFVVDGHSKPFAHHSVFFTTLQMLCRNGGSGKLYENYSNDFFDLIVFDDCQSVLGSWGGILSHFENSLQLGMMDAPHLKAIEYFGEPVFAYSMAQAINDGYLLPFLFESRLPTLEIPDGEFLFDEQLERSIVTAEQTRAIASDLWKALNRFDKNQRKSIVFCVNRASAFFLSASLAEDATVCRTIGEWLSLNRKAVNSYRRDAVSGIPIVYAIADLYRAKRFGRASVEKKLDEKAPKSIRLLFEATCSVVYSENDEKASELFGESLELHAKSTQLASQKQPLFPADLLAVHHSLVWNTLLMNSIQLKSPPKELLPYLATRKSLGLEK